MKYLLLSIYTITAISLLAQPDTEIYVFDLQKDGDTYTIQNPVNITYQNPGYDNQPHFRPDGKLYYVSTRNEQTDVKEKDIREGSWTWLTYTEGSEYSPTPIPDGSGFSAINLEPDGKQLLWKYTGFDDPEVLVNDLKIGYHCWFNEDIVVAFVLGNPVTMQVCNIKTGKQQIVGDSIGRSLHKIPGKPLVSFIGKKGKYWNISSLDPKTGDKKKIINTLEGSEDMCWSPDGTIFMGQDSTLYSYHPTIDNGWQKVKLIDHSVLGKDNEVLKGITRLAISPDGKKIAVVVAE